MIYDQILAIKNTIRVYCEFHFHLQHSILSVALFKICPLDCGYQKSGNCPPLIYIYTTGAQITILKGNA